MQLNLSNSITTPDYCVDTWATKFASFNGTSSKAITNDLGRLPDQLASGTGTIGDNITIIMWVKATWEVPDSPADSSTNSIPIFYLGSDTDVHESIRCYYMIEDSSANNKNDLFIEVRTSSPSNLKQIEFMRLHFNSNPSITGSTSSDHADMWRSGNTNINTNADGFVQLAFTRTTGDWTIYWNGQTGTLGDLDAGTLASTINDYDSFSLGFWEYADFYGKLGMRDFAIYREELSAVEIDSLYNNGVMADYTTLIASSPHIYYPLEEDGDNASLSGPPVNLTLSNVTFESI
tara:strand:+ start:705 stop:1577 length:873 start_codon:yes stop_codon:yes gene_type:complete